MNFPLPLKSNRGNLIGKTDDNYNLRLHSDAPEAARDARIEPVGKPLKEGIFGPCGQRHNFTDANKHSTDDDFEPE